MHLTCFDLSLCVTLFSHSDHLNRATGAAQRKMKNEQVEMSSRSTDDHVARKVSPAQPHSTHARALTSLCLPTSLHQLPSSTHVEQAQHVLNPTTLGASSVHGAHGRVLLHAPAPAPVRIQQCRSCPCFCRAGWEPIRCWSTAAAEEWTIGGSGTDCARGAADGKGESERRALWARWWACWRSEGLDGVSCSLHTTSILSLCLEGVHCAYTSSQQKQADPCRYQSFGKLNTSSASAAFGSMMGHKPAAAPAPAPAASAPPPIAPRGPTLPPPSRAADGLGKAVTLYA